MIDRLHVVEVLDDVEQLLHALRVLAGELDTVLGAHRDLGQLVFAPGTSEDAVMAAALDSGADDVVAGDDGSIEVITAPPDFEAVKAALEKAGLVAAVAEVTMRPESVVALAGEDAQRMQKLIDVIEDLDDVQALYHNAEMAE